MPCRRRTGVVTPLAPLASIAGRAAAAAATFALLAATPAPAARAADLRPYHELTPEPTIVALAPDLDGGALAALLDRLEAAGTRVPVAVARAGLVVVDGPGVRTRLAAEPAIREVLSGPAPASLRAAAGPARGLLRWWNDGFDTPVVEPQPAGLRENVRICDGAKTLEQALAERGGPSLRCNVSGYGRTHFIQGRSIVSLIRPESEGEGTWEDWTADEIESTLAQLTRACHWWSLKSGHSASFVIVDHGTPRTATEPAAPRLDDEIGYIGDTVADLGWSGDCAYVNLDRMNEELKARYSGNWAWTQFILDAEGFLSTSALAYAYLGGPHTVATRGNGPLLEQELARVIAHEMGHIYQALDEYSGACFGCGAVAGYLNVPNDNCVSCPHNEGRCVMRSAGEYSAEDAANMETVIQPCRYTKGAVGLWDTDRDGIADVLSTYPDTRILSTLPDTLESSLNVTVSGDTWDVPFQAPSRFGTPQTINTIRRVEFSVDASQWRGGYPVDGFFSRQSEEWVLYLPELGGGHHRLRVRGVNSVGFYDRYPAEIAFFVHDVKLRSEFLDVYAEPRGFGVGWQVEGEDFGGTYHLWRRRDGAEEVLVADIASRRGRHDRHVFVDTGVDAGHRYRYRLAVDIEGRGTKTLATGEGLAVLPEAGDGARVSVAPNPSAGDFLFSVAVPRGPRAGSGNPGVPGDDDGGGPDFPPRSPDPRSPGDPDDPRSPFTPLWRDVRVAVFDVRGRLVRDLGVFRELESARFNVAWDGLDATGAEVPAGVYFLRVELDYYSEVRKITRVR